MKVKLKIMKRFAWVIGVKEEKLDEYKKLHAAVWPEVLKMISGCKFINYSIYLRKLPDEKYYLFSYLEYTGHNFDTDCAKMAADEMTKRRWADMEGIFHCD